jgi:hypothetical protein
MVLLGGQLWVAAVPAGLVTIRLHQARARVHRQVVVAEVPEDLTDVVRLSGSRSKTLSTAIITRQSELCLDPANNCE